MFKKISHILSSKFKKKDELSRNLEIVKVFDMFREEVEKVFPGQNIEPISLKNKVLTIQMQSSTQASELRLRENKIALKINERVGREVVVRISYRF